MRLRHFLRARRLGFTIVETMIALTILIIIMIAFLLTIKAGDTARSFGTAQIEVQSEARRAMDWIAKDVRQARRVDIGSSVNNPTVSHIKFNMVMGYNIAGLGSVVLSPKHVEYTYNSTEKTITRTETTPVAPPGPDITVVRTLRHIMEPPFYTKITNADGTYSIVPIDPVVVGGDSPMFQSGNLVIKIVGQKQVKDGLTPAYTLIEEVKIRN